MQWKLLFRALGEVLGVFLSLVLLFTLLVWSAITIGIFILPIILFLILASIMVYERYNELKDN